MYTSRVPAVTIAALALATALAGTSASAEKPSWAGGKKHERKQEGSRDGDAQPRRQGGHFGERQAVVVREYYGERIRAGHCPPGLAKKRNGCLPPGQAKKWALGRPLPSGVVYHDLPPALVVELGRPPSGYKYVRVAADILMIAVGTGMVMDAIEDLGRF